MAKRSRRLCGAAESLGGSIRPAVAAPDVVTEPQMSTEREVQTISDDSEASCILDLAERFRTMTDSAGVPIRNMGNGEKMQHKLSADDDAATIARRLTMRVYRMLRGGESTVAFNRPLTYPASGLA